MAVVTPEESVQAGDDLHAIILAETKQRFRYSLYLKKQERVIKNYPYYQLLMLKKNGRR